MNSAYARMLPAPSFTGSSLSLLSVQSCVYTTISFSIHLTLHYSTNSSICVCISKEIGDVDTGLPHLVKLVARNNLLRALPLSVTQLTQLVVLDVSHNQLEMLPPLEYVLFKELKAEYRI